MLLLDQQDPEVLSYYFYNNYCQNKANKTANGFATYNKRVNKKIL